ncbi:MAG TPA: prepilin-type N-terminal cleavage/methylation domain-containing protein [Phycisphaerales bacterium]|nr:prepilin-type N-terminal cleavage/methylation domain-containing protein [Phycisphaerales bacterium]
MKRGFTLIELMICIAVLVVIAALVMPSMDSMNDSTRFRTACDQLSSVASVCRAEARRTGKPVAVVATTNQDGTQSIVSVPLGDAAEAPAGTTLEVDSRVLMVMPKGISIHADVDGADVIEPAPDQEVSIDPVDEATQSLIIYWANGAATAQAPIKVKGPGGRVAGAKVNSFTGTVTVSEEPAETAATVAQADDEGGEPETSGDEPAETTAANDTTDNDDTRRPDVSMDP